MKKGAFFLSLLLCALMFMQGCKSKPAGPAMVETSDTVRFYPIADYFKSQVKQVDSAAVFIYKLTNKGNTKDSSVLTKQQFNQWAQVFTEFDISDKSLHRYYKENIFFDATTHSYTFNYTTMKNTLALQSIDILLDETDQHVKRVFIHTIKPTGDSTVTVKAGWKNGENFFVNRIVEYPGNKTTTEQNVIVWRNQP